MLFDNLPTRTPNQKQISYTKAVKKCLHNSKDNSGFNDVTSFF